MNKDYMNRIEEVAVAASGASMLEAFETRVIKTWNQFDSLAQRVNYDIFTDIPEFRGALRGGVADLLTLLYSDPSRPDPLMDVAQLRDKDARYGGSWCKRGGTGAFHNVARKADRYINQLELGDTDVEDSLGDLRRYLILVMAWYEASKVTVEAVGEHVENVRKQIMSEY